MQVEAAAKSRPVVFVVDDDPALVRVVRAMLEAGGFRVLTAAGGEGLVERILADAPSVLFLDLNLAGASGLEVLEAVRAASADLPVLLLTGESAGAPLARRASELGVLDCLVKPVGLDRLLAAARVAVEVHGLRRSCRLLRDEVAALRERLGIATVGPEIPLA